nr:hypothetical protein [Tanacetum cinerariifolium]
MKIKESLNVKFDESPPLMSPPLEDDDVLECDIIENQEKYLEIKKNEPLNNEIVNIKESKDHPLDTVIEPKNVKEVIQDESWTMTMQEELNQFKTNDVWSLVPPTNNQTIIARECLFRLPKPHRGCLVGCRAARECLFRLPKPHRGCLVGCRATREVFVWLPRHGSGLGRCLFGLGSAAIEDVGVLG